MEEKETVSILSRKELRKQKLMEYLAEKGKLKQPNPKPYLRDEKPVASALKVVMGKENKAPAVKIPSRPDQVTKLPTARGALSVTNKVNVKSSILTGRQNSKVPPASIGPVQPKLSHNPALKKTYTIVSSQSNQNAASQLKKQPNTGISSSASNAACAKVNSSNRFSSNPMKTVSVRMSLGPMVKTKTGLIPAAIQPRNIQSKKLTGTAITAAPVANKVRSSSAQRKTLPSTAVSNHVKTKTGTQVQNENKPITKSLLGKHSQPSSKIQLSSSSSKCAAAPLKPEGRAGAAGELTHRSTKSAGERLKHGQPCKVGSQQSSGPASRSSSRAVSGVLPAAVVQSGGKSKIWKEANGKKEHIPTKQPNVPPPQKRTSAPVMCQTVPRPHRTISHTGQASDTKTPKAPVRVLPQTEGKKLTAAQEERMRKLQEWREAKGISYKRPPMPTKPRVVRSAVHQPFWETMNEEDEANSLICAVDRSLADCIKLLGEGCPPHQVKEVLSRLPAVSRKFAKYWICQARLMEQEGNLDVLPMFEEAVGVVLEPVDELRTVVFDILKKKDEKRASEENEKKLEQQISVPEMTPKAVRALICGEKGNSSVVKYKITATPGGPPSQQKAPARVNGQEVRFFTPVRRSVRIERSSLRYPASLKDHDLCVASYNDLMSEEDGETSPCGNNTPMYVYRENEALKDKVFVQLVYEEGVEPSVPSSSPTSV